MMPKQLFALTGFSTLVAFLGGCAAPQAIEHEESMTAPSALPEGRWTGEVASRTIPDVDNDGEWQQMIALENCSGSTHIHFIGDDGEYSPPSVVKPLFDIASTYVLLKAATENPDGSGWSETQVWTLVDARPKGWSIAQSRSVINQQMDPDEPWFTFRRLGMGWLEYDPDWCLR